VPNARDRHPWQGWPARVALCLLVVLAYANGLTGGFVLDSKVLILEDPRIRQATAANLDLIVQRSQNSAPRPRIVSPDPLIVLSTI